MAERTGKRALIVVSCSEAYTGSGKNNKQFTIYTIEATTDDGTPVTLPLRSFDDLTPNIGKVVEYEVTPYTKGSETTYTLKGEKTPLTPRVRDLERRVDALEEKLEGLMRGGSSGSQSQAAPAPDVVAPADEDIPF